MKHLCRHCGSPLDHQVIDLGHQPPSNAYLTAEQLAGPEITYPLRLLVCSSCWLVQLPAHAAAEELFTPDYAYFSSTSSSWCAHAEHFVELAVQRLNLGPQSHVVELASNDGYLLQYVQQRGIPCLGVEPTPLRKLLARRAFPPWSVSLGGSWPHRWIRLIWWWPTTFWRTFQTSTTFWRASLVCSSPQGLPRSNVRTCCDCCRAISSTRSITSTTAI